LLANEQFTQMMEREIVAHLKKTFGGYEVPNRFLFLREDFTVDNGMLTQTLKLKRRAVLDKHQKDIDALYAEQLG